VSAKANGSQRFGRGQLLAGGGKRLRMLIADHDGLARCMMRTALSEADRGSNRRRRKRRSRGINANPSDLIER
jgi:hypothetical protein